MASELSEETYNRDYLDIERTLTLLEEVSDQRHIFEMIANFQEKYTFIEHGPKLRSDINRLRNSLNNKVYELKTEDE